VQERARDPDESARQTAKAPFATATGGLATPVLALQRTAGNAAVSRALAARRTLSRQDGGGGGGGVVAPPAGPEAEFDGHLAAFEWEEAAFALNQLPAADIDRKVVDLIYEQCKGLLAAMRDSRRIPGNNRIDRPLKRQSMIRDGEIFGRTRVAAAPHHHAAAAGGGYRFDCRITFSPDIQVVEATEVAVVQAVRVIDSGTGANRETLAHLTARQAAGHWSIDRLAGARFPFYGYSTTNRPSGHPDRGGTMRPGSSAPTGTQTMEYFDHPEDSMTGVRFEFETAIVCRSGAQAGLVYSVVLWGFTADASGRLTAHAVRKRDRVSASFLGARTAWNTQATGPAAARSHATQAVVPNLR
jgi:hypothetical protein